MIAVWSMTVLYGMVTGKRGSTPGANRHLVAALVVVLIALPLFYLYDAGWLPGRSKTMTAPLVPPPRSGTGEVFAAQERLVQRELDAIAPGERGSPHLYFVAYGPYGAQKVFLREARYAETLFDNRFGTLGRSLILANDGSALDELPWATTENLERALNRLGKQMIAGQDIVFLYLTSHGSTDGDLAAQLDDKLQLPQLTPENLAHLLDESGIVWRVIVVSSCYSGNFIPALKNEHTLVITAASADRASFGCTDDADFTYFGRALLEQALNRTDSFVDAFAMARIAIDKRETQEHQEHSEPQISSNPAIEARLAQWQKSLQRGGNP